jgi:hypothetical protein
MGLQNMAIKHCRIHQIYFQENTNTMGMINSTKRKSQKKIVSAMRSIKILSEMEFKRKEL